MTATTRMTARERAALQAIGKAITGDPAPTGAGIARVLTDLSGAEIAGVGAHLHRAVVQYVKAQPKPGPHSVCAKCGEHYGDLTNPDISTMYECVPCLFKAAEEEPNERADQA